MTSQPTTSRDEARRRIAQEMSALARMLDRMQAKRETLPSLEAGSCEHDDYLIQCRNIIESQLSLLRLAWWHDDEARIADLSGMTDRAEAHRYQARVIRERLDEGVTEAPC